MRKLIVLIPLLIGLSPLAALAADPVAAHQAAAPTAPPPAAKATIIPGSPLAVLTGASAPAPPPKNPQIDTASPFGSGNLGLSLTAVIGVRTARALNTFSQAVRQSIQLTPVIKWAPSLASLPERRGHVVDILLGLLIAVLPAWVAEAAVRFGLAKPRAIVVSRAARDLPLADGTSELPEPGRAPEPAVSKPIADAEAGETNTSSRATVWPRVRLIVRAIVHFLLSLLPPAGFALVSGIILGLGFVTTRQARLAVIVVCNAYLICRLTLEILRLFLAPKAPPLRLVKASDGRANRVVAWVRVVLFTAAFGYAGISICEILGLPRDGTLVLARLVALAVHVQVAMIIWESRRVVRHWIAGSPTSVGWAANARRRFSRIWHLPALFYILALWIAWAGGIHNSFGLLLRVVLVLFGAMAAGRLIWSGSLWLLDHLLSEGTDSARRATFSARARAYSPLIRIVLQIIIILGCFVLILEGWGIHVVPWLHKDRFSRGLISAFFSIIITIAIALTIWETINALLAARIEHLASAEQTRQAARLRTLLPMLQATIGLPIAVVTGLICLWRIGVNATPLLAGASVLGIAIGFGSQKLVQDIINGLFLLLEDAVQVGDIVNLANMQGTVERLSVRTIRLRGADGSINIIPFSAVTTVTNMTRDFGFAQISIQVGYEEDLPRVYAILEDISTTMREETRWGAMMRDDLQIFGLDQFGASALVITGQIRTGPGQHWAVRREFNARVKQRFEAEHIDMPYAYLAPGPARTEEAAMAAPPAANKPAAEQPAGGKS